MSNRFSTTQSLYKFLLATFVVTSFFVVTSNVIKAQETADVDVTTHAAIIPDGIGVGGKFRLLILTALASPLSTFADFATTNARAAFIVNQSSSQADIRTFSSQFKALVSSSVTDARDNTGTKTGTHTDAPIYWLLGEKVADDYTDFYDGSWDSRDRRNEYGTSNAITTVVTGSTSAGIVSTGNGVDSSGSRRQGTVHGAAGNELDNGTNYTSNSGNVRFLILSPVFTVTGTTTPTISITSIDGESTTGGSTIYINATEDDSNVTISGSSTDIDDSQTITLTISDTDGTTADVTKTPTVTTNAWETTLTPAQMQGLAEGTITVTATHTDAPDVTQTFIYDITAPTLVSPIADQTLTVNTSFDLLIIPGSTFTDGGSGLDTLSSAGQANGIVFDGIDHWSGTPTVVETQTITVTSTDHAGNSSTHQFTINVVAAAIDATTHADIVPTGIVPGDTFRLIFVTRSGTSDDDTVAKANTHVQHRVSSSSITVLQGFSSQFRALVSAVGTNAIDNTDTNTADGDTDAPIYWVQGEKVADNYADFYDSNGWDSRAGKDSSGNDYTTHAIKTGSTSDGTIKTNEGIDAHSTATGRLTPPVGLTSAEGLEIDRGSANNAGTSRFYGISPIFTVTGTAPTNNAPTGITLTLTNDPVVENQTAVGTFSTDDDDSDSHTYTLVTTGTGSEDHGSFTIDNTDDTIAFTTAPDFETPTDLGDTAGDNTYAIIVQTDDGNGGTFTKAFTITVTDVVETPTITITSIDGEDVANSIYINATEDDSDITISGTSTDIANGQTIEVFIQDSAGTGHSHNAQVNNNTWSTDLQSSRLRGWVQGQIGIEAGYTGATPATQNFIYDATAPTKTSTDIPEQAATVGTNFSYPIPSGIFTEATSTPITYTSTGQGNGITFNTTTNTWEGNPTTAETQAIIVTATDAAGNVGATTATFNIVIAAAVVANNAPVITAFTLATDALSERTQDISISDSDTGDTVTAHWGYVDASASCDETGFSTGGTEISLTGSNSSLTGTITYSGVDNNTKFICVRATDTTDTVYLASTAAVSGLVASTTPTISITTIGGESTAGTIYINATEDDSGITIVGTSTNLADNTILDVDFAGQGNNIGLDPTITSNGWSVQLSLANLTSLTEGTVTITVTVQGNTAVTATKGFTYDPTAPVVATEIPDQDLTVGTNFTYTIPANTFREETSTPLTYTSSTVNNGISFATNAWTGTPTTAETQVVTVTATDAAGNTGTDVFNFNITAPPTIAPFSLTAGSAYAKTETLTFSDQDNTDTLTAVWFPSGADNCTEASYNTVIGAGNGVPITLSGTIANNSAGRTGDVTYFLPNADSPSDWNNNRYVCAAVTDGTTVITQRSTDQFSGLQKNSRPTIAFDPSSADASAKQSFDLTINVTDSNSDQTVTAKYKKIDSSATCEATTTDTGATDITAAIGSTNGKTVTITLNSEDDNDKKICVTAEDNSGIPASETGGISTDATPTASPAITGIDTTDPTLATVIPDQTATVGTSFTYQIQTGTFTDSNSLTYTSSGHGTELTFTTDTWTGTPTTATTLTVTVTATDAAGNTVTDEFDIVISAAPNSRPTAIYFPGDVTNTSVAENTTFSTTLTTVDSDDTSHTYSLVSGTGGEDNDLFEISGSTLSSKSTTLLNHEDPIDDDTDNLYSVKIQTDDGNGGTFTEVLTIRVTDVDETDANLTDLVVTGATVTPAFAVDTITYAATVDSTVTSVTVNPTRSHPDATITIGGTAATSGSATTVNLSNGANAIAVVVTAEDTSVTKTYTINITKTSTQTISITAPISTNGYVNNAEDEADVVIYGTTANIVDNETLSFTVSDTDPNTADVTLTTTVGSNVWIANLHSADLKTQTEGTITVTASYTGATSVSQTFEYDRTVPVVATVIPDQTGTTGTSLTYQIPSGTFTDTNALTYTSSGHGSELTFTTDTWTGTPTTATTLTVTVTATDVAGNTVTDEFDIVISASNSNPTAIALDNLSAAENTTAVGGLSTTDADGGDTHTYSLVAGTGDEDNGKFTIDNTADTIAFSTAPDFETPTDAGDTAGDNTYAVRIQTDDGNGGTHSQSFIITVTDVDESVPTPTTPTIEINAISTDGYVNGNEDDSDIIISGTSTDIANAETVTFEIDDSDTSDGTDIARIPVVGSDGTWSTTLTPSDIQGLAEGTVTVTVSYTGATDATKTFIYDTTAPTVSTARTGTDRRQTDTIVIGINENLAGTATTTDFTISYDNVTDANPTSVSLENGNINIRVSTEIERGDDSITVSYSGSTITDVAGNALALFSGTTVENRVRSSSGGGGGSLFLSGTGIGNIAPVVPDQYGTEETAEQIEVSLPTTAPIVQRHLNLQFKRDLSVETRGEDVKELQEFLNNNGFPVSNSGAGSSGQETNYFGPATQKALAEYQETNDIPATGYLGEQTRQSIQKSIVINEIVRNIIEIQNRIKELQEREASSNIPTTAEQTEAPDSYYNTIINAIPIAPPQHRALSAPTL